MVTKEEICQAIAELGLSNRVICLHSSLKSFGHIEGGAPAIINGFLERGCTVFVPTFYYDAIVCPPHEKRLKQNGCDYSALPGVESKSVIPYSPQPDHIVKDMGAVPAGVLKMEGSLRGDHPINSFAAIGPLAEDIIRLQKPLDVYGPFRKIYEIGNASIVLMGVDFTKTTPIHFAEQLAGRRLFRAWAKISENTAQETEVGSCSEGFNNLEPYLANEEKKIMVGESKWRIYSFNDFIDKAVSVIKQNPMITHCGHKNCIRCNDAVKGGPIFTE